MSTHKNESNQQSVVSSQGLFGLYGQWSLVSFHMYYLLSRKYLDFFNTWWRHQMETSSALLAICAGNSPVTGEFPAQRPVTRSFDVFFDLRLNKRLSKQSWGWWFETLSCPLWRHRNDMMLNTVLENKTDDVDIWFSSLRSSQWWRHTHQL